MVQIADLNTIKSFSYSLLIGGTSLADSIKGTIRISKSPCLIRLISSFIVPLQISKVKALKSQSELPEDFWMSLREKI
jgi:hypothetical protein